MCILYDIFGFLVFCRKFTDCGFILHNNDETHENETNDTFQRSFQTVKRDVPNFPLPALIK